MKLIMTISADGFVARDEEDDMSWSGRLDKRVFRVLTCCDRGVCAVGKRTAAVMPAKLPGRTLVVLSSDGITLSQLQHVHPDAWLLGGQTIALKAFKMGIIYEAHIFRSKIRLGAGIFSRLEEYLDHPVIATDIEDEFTIEVYRRNNGIRAEPLDMV